jgi:hypothetical protein
MSCDAEYRRLRENHRVSVVKNRVEKNIFLLKREKVTVAWRRE